MPFKIVQTCENDMNQLTICPSGWERHGILHWPLKKIKKLIKIEDSLPKPDWSIMKCFLKRKNISNYDTAEKELQNMLECTSSEQEQVASLSIDPAARQQEMVDFNEIAKQATVISSPTMQNSETVYVYETGGVYLNTDFNPDVAAVEENVSQVIQNSDSTDKIANNQNMIFENQQLIINNQKVLIENQKQLMQNQGNIMMAIAEISVKLDNVITTAEAPLLAVSTLNETTKNSMANTVFTLKPIRSSTELSQLEDILQDDKMKAEYKSKYSIVCGSEKAANCAYKLCDVFFSRDFLTQCSWSGCARGEVTKVSLKMYKNVLNLFFSLVYECDKSYTIADNEKFFKSILKNSTKRKLSKLQRTSTCRNSHKRQKTNNINADNVQNEENLPNEANVPNEVNVPNKENLPNEANLPNEVNVPNEANVPNEENIAV